MINKGSLTINILLILSLFFFSFGQIGRIAFPGQPVFIYIFEPLIFCIVLLLGYLYRSEPWKAGTPFIRALLIFFGWLIISFIMTIFQYSQLENTVAFLYLLRLIIYFVFFVYLSYYIHKHREVARLLYIVIGGVFILIIITSLTQYFLYPNFGNIAYLGWDPHLYRLVGLFFDPPLTVSILSLFFIFALLLLSNKTQSYFLPILALLSALIFLTYSRGGYLALLVTISFYALKNLKRMQMLLILVVIVGAFLLIPKGQSEGVNLLRTTSIFTRTADYEKAIAIWKKRPLFGIGYNHIRYEKDTFLEEPITDEYNPSHASASFHSSFLMILVTGGVVGFIFFMWLLYTASILNEYAKYALIFVSVISLTDNVLLHPFILFLLFVLISIFNYRQQVEQARQLQS